MTKYFVDVDGVYMGGFDGEDVELPVGGIEVPTAPASAKDLWVNGAWVPHSTVPESVPKLNARLILIAAGYWDDVVAFITAQGPVALAFLQDAQTMRRDNPLVNAWAAAQDVGDSELDALFIAAGDLNPDEFHG